MLAASGSMFVASTALAVGPPGGNNGTVLINGGNIDDKGNDPHLSCPIVINWSGFDANPPAPGNHYDVSFTGVNPTGGTINIVNPAAEPPSGDFLAADTSATFHLTSPDAKPNHKGEIHVNITVSTTSAHQTITKSKTVWLQGCAVTPPANTVTVTGSCDTASHVFSWLVVSDPVDTVDGTWTPHSGGAATAWSVASGSSFTTGLVNDIDLTAPGWTLAASHVTAAPNAACAAPAVVDPTAQASANCNTLSAHLVAGTSDTTFDIVHNGVTEHVAVTKNTTQDVSYNNSGAGATITVSANGKQLDSKSASNSCGGNPGNPTPASASATADCSALTAHLDGGTNGATFTVTEPNGSHQVTVGPGATDNVSYGSGNGAVITVSTGNTVLDTKSAPTNCTSAGAADPQASEVNHCQSGMNLTLSNMNGTADTTFTVTDPDGNTQQVDVRAGQLKKLTFAVTEDTTGTLTVAAPGLAKQTFTYKKDCASVLGVKHTRKPTVKTHKPTVVKAEHAQLPFTGFNTRRALLDGAGLFFFGAVLCMLGARRKDEDYVY